MRLGQLEMIACDELESGWLAEAAHFPRVLVGIAVRRSVGRRIRDAREQIVALRRGAGVLVLESLQLLLYLAQLIELFRSRLAFEIRLRAQLRDPCLERAPAFVYREEIIEDLVGTLAGERGTERVGVVPRCADVDHRAKNASTTCATPSSSTGGQTRSAIAFNRASAFATATP